MSIFIRTNNHLNPDSEPFVIEVPFSKTRKRVLVEVGEECLVKQSFKNDCDVNIIVARYAATGQLPPSTLVPAYEDVSSVPSFQEALGIVMRAQDAFSEQSPEVRARFSNDPAAFVAFVDNPVNREEAVRLGLVKPLPSPVVDKPAGGNVPT